VQKALKDIGYSPDESSRIIDVVGTRLRQLEGPLGMSKLDVDGFITRKLTSARTEFNYLLKGLGDADAEFTKAIFDSLAAGTPVSYFDVPKAVREQPTFPKVFYVTVDSDVSFQNRTLEVVWQDPAQREQILKSFKK
jgi:hypothetical protein